MVQLIAVDSTQAAHIRTDIASGHKDRVPGAVRMSLGLGTTHSDVDYAVGALETIIRKGPKWSYRLLEESGEYAPDPETRPLPYLSTSLGPAAGVSA
jgi:hypothetical protein